MPAPTVTVLSSSELQVSWTAPIIPGGLLSGYMVFRDDVSVFNTTGTLYIASGLLPFTTYTFVIFACNPIGCGAGPSASATTAEAVPTGLAAPQVVNVGSRNVALQWTSPATPNGIIQAYNIYVRVCTSATACPANNGQQMLSIAGTRLTATVSNLLPYTYYQFRLEAVSSAGATLSPWVPMLSNIPNAVLTLPASMFLFLCICVVRLIADLYFIALRDLCGYYFFFFNKILRFFLLLFFFF